MKMAPKFVGGLCFFYGALFFLSCLGSPASALAFTCDSGDLNGACVVSTTQLVSNGEVITGTGDLVIVNGGNLTCNAGESFSIAMDGDVVIESGGSITGNLSSLTTENLIIESGGAISADAKGLASGQGEGTGDATSVKNEGGGGAGHGGSGGGGYGGSGGGGEYGSPTAPETPGSGGGYNTGYASEGGHGGGVIRLVVDGTLTLDGAITCNGGAGTGCFDGQGGGGSGGSVWINAGVLEGGGSITANGGAGDSTFHGGGGGAGGRIAVYYDTDGSTIAMQAFGGYSVIQYGGAGTVFTKAAADSYGDLKIDNNGISGASTSQVVAATVTLDSMALSNNGYYIVPAGSELNILSGFANSTANASITNNGTLSLPATSIFTNITLYNNGSIEDLANLTLDSSSFYQDGAMDDLTDLTVGANSTFDFQNLTPQTPVALSSVTILDTGVLTHEANGAALDNSLNLHVTGNLDIQTGGAISADAKGLASGQGEGTGDATSVKNEGGGGAGHGGSGGGGYGGSGGGGEYGSPTAPETPGSGGGYNTGYASEGGHGGGVIRLVVDGTLTLDGAITCNGGAGTGCFDGQGGGGSGGSVWINAGVLEGGGSITANGGAGDSTFHGGGGGAGGRIAVYYDTDGSTIAMQAFGGYSVIQYGGAGTVFTKAAADSYGDLKIDNNGISGASTSQVVAATVTLDSMALSNNGYYIVPAGSELNILSGFANSTANASITNNGTLSLPATSIFTNITLYNNGSIEDLANLTLDSSSFYQDGAMDDLTDLTVGANSTFDFQNLTPQTPVALSSVTILDTGVLTHEANGAALDNSLNLHVTGNLDIQTGGAISADAKGLASGQGEGTGDATSVKNEGGGGAGHGGSGGGGYGGSGGGGEYGSPTAPETPGSGGGYNTGYASEGGHGGGVIRLVVDGTLTLDGAITCNGGAGTGCFDGQGGGGSGGSVWINAGVLEGGGSITANGGAGDSTFHGGGGGGGGGRIAVYYDTDGSTIAMQAFGGYSVIQYGGAGTVFTKAAADSYGDLKIDNKGISGASTSQVVAATVTLDSMALSNNGYYIVPAGSELNILSGFANSTANASITNNGTLTLPATSIFTNITLYNNGSIEDLANLTLDSSSFYQDGAMDDLTDLTVGANSTFDFQNLTPQTPVALSSVTILDTGVLTHEANGAALDNSLNLHVTGNLDIQTGGAISADAKGLASGQGEGTGDATSVKNEGGGGAGHGGSGGGGYGGSGGGGEYGSPTAPETPGSGGGYNTGYASEGGHGGGVIRLVVDGTLTLDGAITCNGGAGTGCFDGQGGGGSGGSVWINAGVLEGGGSITANGGAGDSTFHGGGGGGGGRIAIEAASDLSSLTKLAIGGTGFQSGEIGTIYPIPPKAITAFSFDSPPAVGAIDEDAKTVALEVPYGTGLTGLVPTITITGVSVSPASGAAQDFTDGVPITYTVTAYDTSTQDYGVTVNVGPPSSNNTVTSDAYTISTGGTGFETIVNVPFGISLADFLAALTAGDGTQNWDSSDLTDPVISRQVLIVTAQDGSTVTYTIYINLTPGDADHDGEVTFADAILCLQSASNTPESAPVYFQADVDGDGLLGLEDALYILQTIVMQ